MASGETIKEYLVGLGFDVDQTSLAGFNSALKSTAVVAAALVTAVAGASLAVSKFVLTEAKGLDELSDFSKLVGESASRIAELSFEASIMDSSAEAVRSSLRGVSKAAGESIIGIGRGAIAFEKLGINAKNSKGEVKSAGTLLDEIGQKVKDLSKPEQIAALSKLGIDPTLVSLITKGPGGLKGEFNEIFSGLGIDLDKAADASSDLIDAQTKLSLVFATIRQAVAIKLMPMILRGLEAIKKKIVANLPLIVKLVEPVMRWFLAVGEALLAIGMRGGQAIGLVISVLDDVNDRTQGWAGYIVAALAAWKLLNLGVLASPIGLVFVLGAAILLLVDDFLTAKEGGESAIDWTSNWGTALQVLGGTLAAVLASIAAVRIAQTAWIALQGVASLASFAFGAALSVVRTAVLLFNLALFANPIGLFIGAIVLLAAAAATFLVPWKVVGEWFAGWFKSMGVGFDGIVALAGKVGGFLGFGGGGGAPASAPGPRAQAAVGGSNQTISQTVSIKVDGAGSPEAVAERVGRAQRSASDDLTRNLAGATR